MAWNLRSAVERLRTDLRLGGYKPDRPSTLQQKSKPSAGATTPSENHMPLPPPPRELLAGRVQYEVPLLNRKVDREKDTPTAALYRIYEHLVLDQHIELRNEIEAFWHHSSWLVRDIPDPKDPNPERYACLACIPKLLCLAFNKRIDLGLPRDAPPIFTQDMLAEWRAQDRTREQPPAWVNAVPKLEHQLAIPHWDNDRRDFVPLDPTEDSKVSREFAEKNIIIWHRTSISHDHLPAMMRLCQSCLTH